MVDFLRFLLSVVSTFILIFLPQKSYTDGLVGQPTSFIPSEATTENDKTVSKLLFRGLFKYDEAGELVEDLADSYDISDDGLSYTVYLKKGERWSNGSEITADDLLYSAFNSASLSEVATDKIDKYTIRYTLPNRYSPFLSILTQGVAPSLTKNDKLKPVSSGPYRVIRVKKEGPVIKEVDLQSSNLSFKIPKVSFRYYENEDQLFSAFKLGEIDGFVSEKAFEWANMSSVKYVLKGIHYSLIFNTQKEKVNKAELRKKILEATPLEEIANNRGVVAKGALSMNEFQKAVAITPYKPDAKDDLKLNLAITFPDTEEHWKTYEILKSSWAKLGITTEAKALTSSQIESEAVEKRDYEILLYGQEVSRDPDRYPLWHSTRVLPPGQNLSAFENIRLDRSLEEGRAALGRDDRKKHYDIFQDVINENTPVIFLYHPYITFYYNNRVVIPESTDVFYPYGRFNSLKDWTTI